MARVWPNRWSGVLRLLAVGCFCLPFVIYAAAILTQQPPRILLEPVGLASIARRGVLDVVWFTLAAVLYFGSVSLTEETSQW